MSVDRMYPHLEGRVPFAPIPDESCEMRFRHDDPWTFRDTPIAVAWKAAYRDACHALIFGNDDAARQLADLGRALEDAYLVRTRRATAERGAR